MSAYSGPPAYRDVPRWGLPRVIWRPTRQLDTMPSGHLGRMRVLAGSAGPLLWLAAAVALLTAAAEGWRYAILLASRTDAVRAGPLRVSDALVVTGSVMSLLAGALAASVALAWLIRGYAAASESAGVAPARPPWQIVAGALVPGVNLLLPAAVLAEMEHAALGGDPARRPRPSRLIVSWWVVWAAGLLLAAITMLWRLRDTVQAQADGVLLTAATDVLAAAVAGFTAIVVKQLTRLLAPGQPLRSRRMVVVGVPGRAPSRGATRVGD